MVPFGRMGNILGTQEGTIILRTLHLEVPARRVLGVLGRAWRLLGRPERGGDFPELQTQIHLRCTRRPERIFSLQWFCTTTCLQ